MPLVKRVLKATDLKVEGVHMHTGSDIMDANVFLMGAEILFNIAKDFPDLKYIDFGSGFKVPYKENDIETDYVVEATDVLNSLSEAKLHLSTAKRGVRLRHLIEEEQLRKSQGRESASSPTVDGDPMALLYGGCKNVIIAGPSDDAPLFCVGINDDMSSRGGTLGDGSISLSQTPVASHVSAPVAALAPILYLINKSFKIKSCSYTLLRSVKGGPKR